MDRRVLILRRWLLIAAVFLACWRGCPAGWFAIGPALILAPIVWTRTTSGTTGVLIHPAGTGVAVGDDADPTCACCGPCVLFGDDFATDGLAANYDVRAGAWAVVAGQLTTTSGAALVVANTVLPAALTGQIVSATVFCETFADIGRLVGAYASDGSYWFVEVQDGTPAGTVKLFERVGGVDTQRGATKAITFSPAHWTQASLCIANGVVTATGLSYSLFGSATVVIAHVASPALAGTKAGMGTGAGSSNVRFDTFRNEKVKADDVNCAACAPVCQFCGGSFGVPPQNIQVVVEGYVYDAVNGVICDNANRTYIVPNTAVCGWSLPLSIVMGGAIGTITSLSTEKQATVIRHTFGFTGSGGLNSNFQGIGGPISDDCLSWSDVPHTRTPNTFVACGGGTVTYKTSAL